MSEHASAKAHQREHPTHEIVWTGSGEWGCTGSREEDCDAAGSHE